MKFSRNWLRELVQLPETVEALAELLTMSGIEIEGIENRGADFDKVVVARISSSTQHPNADRLTVCEVDDGSGTIRQIVCGAKNYKVGDKVPLALPGSELSGGLQIERSPVRGVESEGMLCSGKELGVSDDASGLLILPAETKLGAPIRELFPPDIVLDVEITPNRGDLLSHFGLAREIGALIGKRVITAAISSSESPQSSSAAAEPPTQITISALRECPFYSARLIEKIKVGPSPLWLRNKIENVGVRSINNIVDITNYVMLEIGQPLHAFDADKLRGDINVRLARDGEEFLALDGRTYRLTSQHLVIADSQRAVAIAGVMGGEDTGVSERTRNVLLESAYFLPGSVRQTVRALNLPSDSSYRFERGVDPQMIMPASDRAGGAICRLGGGRIRGGIATAGELPPKPPKVTFDYGQATRILGVSIKPSTADEILGRFGVSKSTTDHGAKWEIPSHRRDLQRDVDLIEEIVRVFGVDKIPLTERSRFTPASEADRRYDFETRLRRDLVAFGLNEVRTSALIARSDVNKSDHLLELRNPLSEDNVALRAGLLPGLLGALGRNARAGMPRVALFEIGSTFSRGEAEQRRSLGVILSGEVQMPHWRNHRSRMYDFFDLKGIIENLRLGSMNGRCTFRRTQQPGMVLAADILFNDIKIGICGQLSQSEAAMFDAKAAVFVAEVEVRQSQARQTPVFEELERFPAIRRDIAMFVPTNVSHELVLKTINSADEPLLERAELFDLFTENVDGKPDQGRKSLAYSLTYRDKNRTLTSEEINAVHARIRERLRNEIGAELRE